MVWLQIVILLWFRYNLSAQYEYQCILLQPYPPQNSNSKFTPCESRLNLAKDLWVTNSCLHHIVQ